MGLRDRFFTKVRGLFVGPEQEYLRGRLEGAPFDFGVNVTNESAMKLTALYAGIRIRSENLASLPKSVTIETEKGHEDVFDHPASKLFTIAPNEYTNTFDFWQSISATIDGWGNAYAVIIRDTAGRPTALHQVHPSCVQVSFQNGRKYYKVTTSSKDFKFLDGVYPSQDMLHFMLVTFDGIMGVNPVIYNAIAIGNALATEKFSAEYFKKGGNLKAVLETDGHLGDEEYNAFMQHYSAAASNFESPLLEYGIKYKQIGISPIAAQLIQSKTFSIQDVCRILNLPPHLLAEMTHATFSNVEHQTTQFVMFSIRPTVKRLEVELENKLLFDKEKNKYSIKFALDGLLRGDTATRSAFYHNAIQDGWLSRNEVRIRENMTKLDGLDDMMYPANMNIVGDNSLQQIDTENGTE